MATVRSRGGPRLTATGLACGALGAAVLGWLVWLSWDAARTVMLQREVAAAVEAADADRTAAALDGLIRHRPGDLDAVRLRVEIAVQRGDRAAAIRLLAAVPAGSPEAASAHLRRGLLLKEMLRVREAEAALREAARLMPTAPEPRRELIALLGIERRVTEQEAELWALHDRTRQSVEALRMLGQSHVIIPPGTLAKTSDEGVVLERRLQSDPSDPHLRPSLARFYRMRGQTDVARRLLDGWLREHPDDPGSRVAWLAVLLDDGDVESASPWFRALFAPLRDDADYRRLRGDWLVMQDRHADALADYREAARLAPRDPEVRYRLAQALRAAGQDAEAAEALAYHEHLEQLARLSAAVTETAPTLDSVLAAARACRALGPPREREARAWLAEAMKIDPGNAEARAALKPLDRAGHAEPAPGAGS